jgi:zinc/manganese transport system substrate-binding protein
MNRRIFLATTVSAFALLPLAAFAQEKMPVVASFSILGDMVANVGGDRVEVTTIVGPDGDAHVYSPTPADAQAVASAQVVFVNGLAFEGWLDRLIEASEYEGPVIVTTEGVDLLEMAEEGHDEEGEEHAEGEAEAKGEEHGGADPHAWQSLANARVYVTNIEAGLAAADPDGTATYAKNAAAYLAEIDQTESGLIAAIATLPDNGRTIVTSHDAFGYFADAYGLTFLAPEGMSTEAEASAADVAALITQIRANGVSAVFLENITNSRLVEQIASETDAKLGGMLYSDALSGPNAPAATYLDMMRHNAVTLTTALGE